MTVWFKMGVMGYLAPQAQKGFGRVVRLYDKHGLDICVTSIEEGNHQGGSFHYIKMAWDWKRNGILIKQVKDVLGPDFDVIEYEDMDIFHAEYDPK